MLGQFSTRLIFYLRIEVVVNIILTGSTSIMPLKNSKRCVLIPLLNHTVWVRYLHFGSPARHPGNILHDVLGSHSLPGSALTTGTKTERSSLQPRSPSSLRFLLTLSCSMYISILPISATIKLSADSHPWIHALICPLVLGVRG